jgi:histidinol-phosphate aminotransferase
MASNENPLGSSPAALAAIRGALGDLNYYPDGSGYDLKRVLSRKLGVAAANLVLGNGSNDVLELVARAFLTRDDSAVLLAARVHGLSARGPGDRRAAIEVPARDYGNDLDALAAAVRADTKIVFVANPNNPPAPSARGRDRAVRRARAARVLVVLDEAYGEYLPDELASPTRRLARALSQRRDRAHALQGLRPRGAARGIRRRTPEWPSHEPRAPAFNVNHLAMVAAAAALDDSEFIARVARRQRRGAGTAAAGFRASVSNTSRRAANFITVRVVDADRSTASSSPPA